MTLQSTNSDSRTEVSRKLFSLPQRQDTVPARRLSGQSSAQRGPLKFVVPATLGVVLGIICVLLIVLLSILPLELSAMVVLLALASALVIRVTRRNWKR